MYEAGVLDEARQPPCGREYTYRLSVELATTTASLRHFALRDRAAATRCNSVGRTGNLSTIPAYLNAPYARAMRSEMRAARHERILQPRLLKKNE